MVPESAITVNILMPVVFIMLSPEFQVSAFIQWLTGCSSHSLEEHHAPLPRAALMILIPDNTQLPV
jgi:hypothetical protein